MRHGGRREHGDAPASVEARTIHREIRFPEGEILRPGTGDPLLAAKFEKCSDRLPDVPWKLIKCGFARTGYMILLPQGYNEMNSNPRKATRWQSSR